MCASSAVYLSSVFGGQSDTDMHTNIQQMIRWMCGVSMKDRRTSEELREVDGV